jgi:phosphate transport system substrate-binding protein
MTRAIALILSCLAGAACAGPVAAETIRVGGTGGPLEAMRLTGEAFHKIHPQTNVTIVPGLGSRGGIKALQAGAVDVAVSATAAPAASEPGLVWVELGRTPIIFATASARPGVGVTTADLVEIFSGRKTTWPDGSRLRVILRPNGDSDTAFLRAISPAMDRAVDDGFKLSGVKIAATDQDAADAIGSIPGAVGVTTLLQVRAEARPLTPLPVSGVAPGLAAIANGSYPYAKTLYFVMRAPVAGVVQEYLTFLASPAGRELLAGFGLQVSPGLIAALRGAK